MQFVEETILIKIGIKRSFFLKWRHISSPDPEFSRGGGSEGKVL